MLPGVARLDYATIRIISKPKFDKLSDQTAENYLVMGRQVKIIFQKYKTSKTYGIVNIPIAKYSRPRAYDCCSNRANSKALRGDAEKF